MKIQQFSEHTRLAIEWGGGVMLSIWVALLFLLGSFEVLELLTYDCRFALRGEREPLKDILIINIDEISEEKLQQRMPWKRSLHAKLIRTLMEYSPKLIVYDVIFQHQTDPKEDEELANALYDAYDEQRELSLVILAQYISPQRLEQPAEMFVNNTGGVGIINLSPGRDNIVRSVPVATKTIIDAQTSQYHLCLGLEAAALYKGGVNSIEFPDRDTTVLSRVQDGTQQELFRIIAPDGRLYINFIGGRYAYPMIPFWKILHREFQPEDIEGKVIFIGDTSLTAHDYFLIPFRNPSRKFIKALQEETLKGARLTKVPTFGIEIHAQAFQTVLEDTYIRRLSSSWSVILILFVGGISGIVLFKDRGFLINTAMLFLFGGMVWGVSQYLFNTKHLWLDLAPLELVIILTYVVGQGFQRAVALYNRNKVKGAFQQYVSTAVVEEMLKHPEKLRLGGERKFLTVLFSDIRGFTSISEKMDSQELVEFLNEYLTEMTEIVMRYDGTLDKYMGDAIMAIYGAPIDQEDHAFRACMTALDMMTRLRELQQRWQAQGKPPIDIGIGMNSGLMLVGNMGSEKRFDFTVMGDHVNLGSRLEGINRQYGTNIILSEYTYHEVKDAFAARELDLVRVKGKEEPVRIFELLGRTGQIDTSTSARIERFEQGLSLYRQMRWNEAIKAFEHILKLAPNDTPAQLYIQRCQAYQAEPPPETWDGVYIMTTK